MKKWMVGLLIVGMLLALTACGAVKTEPTPSRQIAAARLDQDGNDMVFEWVPVAESAE